jgi:putative hydrolase of the HAD superfamily
VRALRSPLRPWAAAATGRDRGSARALGRARDRASTHGSLTFFQDGALGVRIACRRSGDARTDDNRFEGGSSHAAQCGRISVAAFWQGIGNTLRLTSGDVEQLRTDFYRGDVRNDALVARIDAMRQAGLRLGILSNFSRELWTLLERQDLSHRFDAIAVSADIGVMKPAPAAYHAILNMLRLPPEACLFIDDLPDNIAAAQALGLHGLVFRDSPSCLAEINRLLAGSLPS